MACKDTVVCLWPFLMLPHRFRWVYCQLDVLRQCFPSSVRSVLAELPESLDETYERILQQIPKPNRVHTHRLLQCLVVAARPLNVEELAEVLAIDFSGTGVTPMMDEDLRWENKERAVLSACSSLITIIQGRRSHLVQFSHFSVKEFLTSDRLAASTVDSLRYHRIRLEAAHVMMAQVCLSVLLRLENHMDKQTIWSYPLSKYAGNHFGDHVEFENVISSIRGGVDRLLDGEQPHFYTWVWLQIGDWRPNDWHNSKIDRDSEYWHNSGSHTTPFDDTKPTHAPRLPALYYVAALGHLCLTRHIILKSSQDLDVRDSKGCTPLHIAVLAGEEGVSLLLIEHSVDLDIRDIDGRIPLHMVAHMGLTKATHMLLERRKPLKSCINARDKNGRMPLHLALDRGHSGIAELLLRFGADVDAQDNDTMTPLHLVSRSRLSTVGDDPQITETAQVLLEHSASVHVRNNHGQTPLRTALHRGRSGIVALLLKYGADVDAQDNDAMTPLLSVLNLQPAGAQYSLFTKGAQLLLEHGASVRVRNKDGQMPLHRASHLGLPDMVALFLKFGADVDAQDNDTMTPLLLVSQSQPFMGQDSPYTKTAQLLLEHGASVHMRDRNGQMPLHLALRHGLFGIVALLLQFGANVDAQDNDTMTPLLLVSQPRYSRDEDPQFTKTAQALLKHGASVQVRNESCQTPLHTASRHGLFGMVALLLKFGADVDAQDNDAMTPLHLVSQPRYSRDEDPQFTETAQVLLGHGASVYMRDRHGQMPLHKASRHGLSSMVALLLRFGAEVDTQDSDAMTPLLLVSHGGHVDDDQIINTAQSLLEHGARVHMRNKNGQTPLHLASHYGFSGIVGLLLKFGADVNAQDNDTMTPLLLVSQCHGREISRIIKTAQLLLDHGASVHVRNRNGQMPLHTALHHGLFGIVALLLKFGTDANAPDNDTITPLQLVSQSPLPVSGNDSQITETAQLLLEHGAIVHVRNKNGQMPLHTALHHGLSGIVALLLTFGVDVDAPDDDTMTPLHLVSQASWACDSQITQTAQVLLEHGASVHVRNQNGQMPLHTALPRGLCKIVALLLKFGADVDAQDNDTMTPLHLVSQTLLLGSGDDFKSTRTVQLLLEHGASVHVQNEYGQTPLHTASRHGLSCIVELLLKFGAAVDAEDNDAMTPLLLVSQHRWGDDSRITKTAQVLLEHGASVHVRNKGGLTPLHSASHHGLSDIVALLLKFGAAVDA